MIAVADPEFPRRGRRQPQRWAPTSYFGHISQKLHNIKKIGPRKSSASLAPPPPRYLPMDSLTYYTKA